MDEEEMDILARALVTAAAAARAAGDYLRAKQGHVVVAHKKAAHDDLLDADLEAERIILDALREAFPHHAVLSEEAGDIEDSDRANSTSPYRWIVDPLDGSSNYQHGSPLYGVALALQQGDTTLLAVIHLPARGEMYTAIRGEGAQRDGHAIEVSQVGRLGDALIHFGDFATTGRHQDNAERINAIAKLADAAGRVRMVGSAATDLAYVACGLADGHVIFTSYPWDVEAGLLLVSEAGGHVSRLQAAGQGHRYICGNPRMETQLRAALDQPAGPAIK